MIGLALATGTDPEAWFRADDRTVATALELLWQSEVKRNG